MFTKNKDTSKISADVIPMFLWLNLNTLRRKWTIYVIAVYSCYSPAGIYLNEFNNGNTRMMIEICSELTAITSERCH